VPARPAPAALALAVLLAAPALAAARTSIVYDEREAARTLLAPGPDGRPDAPAGGWLQQAPGAEDVLPAERRAGKVTAGAPTAATPGLRGRDAAGVEAVLVEAIRRSGAHVVFVDELGPAFRGAGGAAFADALARLDRPSPWGGTWARRVHVYVPTLPDLLARPAAWAHAWRALAGAGGVWFQTYRGDMRPWSAGEWAVWAPAWRRRMAEAGGDPTRLHPVLSRGDQDAVWRAALTGEACALTANGPGAFRLGRDAAAFRSRYLAAFGPDGTRAPACLPSGAPAPGLDALATWTASGAPVGAHAVLPAAAPAGARTALRVDLGRDPLGVAALLGGPPALVRAARPTVWAVAPGHVTSARLDARGRATLVTAPMAPGPLRIEVRLQAAGLAPGAPGHGWVERLDAAGAPPDALSAAILFPATWRLRIPLRSAAGGDPVAAVAALAPVRRLALTVSGRRTPTGRRVLVGRAVRADGTPGAYARLVVRLPGGRPYVLRADVRGAFRVTAVRGRVTVTAGRARVSRLLPRTPR